MVILTRAFWDYAGNRASRSFAQSIVVLAAAQVQPFNVFHADWLHILGISLGYTVASVCTSLIGYTPPSSPPATPPAEPVTEPIPPVEFPLEHSAVRGEHEAL